MGNVSSADHEKVNELLTKRALKKAHKKQQQQQRQLQLQQQQQQQQQQQEIDRLSTIQTYSFYDDYDPVAFSPVPKSPRPQFYENRTQPSQPLPSQADFYSSSSNGFTPSSNGHPKNIMDFFPTSPISASSNASTITSDTNNTLYPGLRTTDDRQLDSVSSPAQQPPLRHYHNHSSPIIPQQRGHNSTSSLDDTVYPKSPSPPIFVPSRRGSEHHVYYHQQQQERSADLRLGSSPEAKDWLRQKPTRSSTQMIHQYNYQSHQYYQQPGSGIKIVNNTCRNMTGYAVVPSIPQPMTSKGISSIKISTGAETSRPQNGSNGTTAHNNNNNNNNKHHPHPASNPDLYHRRIAKQTYVSDPIPNIRTKVEQNHQGNTTMPSLPTPASTPRTADFEGQLQGTDSYMELENALPVSPKPKKDPLSGTSGHRLVMSRSKLAMPLAPPSYAVPDTPVPRIPDGIEKNNNNNGPVQREQTTQSGSSSYRPSSTLSSLRSLLGNHPQGLSLIESLEEDDEDDQESLSDTETGDSEEADLAQRTQSMTVSDSPLSMKRKKSQRRRPPPQFEWMAARRRFSSSSISTISRDIQDSQKGQHALWKYIGGGNSHAPLRYDIDRILDSGCGLGEWTMEMAKEFPNATVYGIDINPELFPNAREPVPSNCLFTQSNLLNRLSFPDRYFDFVFQRFLYLGLTVDDWPVALKELRRVMKPGAWIELFEPCMRVHRAGPRTREVMRWISRLLQEERGLDFDFAGEKMKRLCESSEIGFINVRLERLSIPVGSWGGRVGQAMAENMVLIFQNLQSALSMDDPSSPSARPSTSSSSPNNKSHKLFELMVQSWVRECEENKSYLDYYILVAQKAS
ncbi:hypothetical protein BG004_001030 [Podila humilis]|nr:hypothetical protein BG004_001030 [Podila humilis]